jgi:HlyD family secretion protein
MNESPARPSLALELSESKEPVSVSPIGAAEVLARAKKEKLPSSQRNKNTGASGAKQLAPPPVRPLDQPNERLPERTEPFASHSVVTQPKQRSARGSEKPQPQPVRPTVVDRPSYRPVLEAPALQRLPAKGNSPKQLWASSPSEAAPPPAEMRAPERLGQDRHGRTASDNSNRTERISKSYERALAGELRRGGRVLAVAAIVTVGWAGLMPLASAVVVPGTIVVRSSVKKVQHPAGGVVAEVFVHNGSKVKAGDPLLRLDETAVRANLQVIARQLDEVRLKIVRLVAERDGAEALNWPRASMAEVDPSERDRQLASEIGLFLTRMSARRSEQELAESRIMQLEKQIGGLEAQRESNNRQIKITADELKNVEAMLLEKLVTIQRATTLEREAARLDGIEGQLVSQIAELRNKVNETRLQALQAKQTVRTDIMRELGEAEAKQGELHERRIAAEDVLKRTVVRAPSGGAIHDLAIHTSGGVVSPAEVLMTVVPVGEALEIDARLSPDKIDQVKHGQKARVRLSAFNASATPELTGSVNYVSPDLVRDQQTAAAYYAVRITLPQDEVVRLNELQLVPGMPAEVFLETGSRTMLSYMFKPITDQLARSFRER